MQGIKDKVSIVTGGAQGLGYRICERFAKEGAVLVIADINLEGEAANGRMLREKNRVYA